MKKQQLINKTERTSLPSPRQITWKSIAEVADKDLSKFKLVAASFCAQPQTTLPAKVTQSTENDVTRVVQALDSLLSSQKERDNKEFVVLSFQLLSHAFQQNPKNECWNEPLGIIKTILDVLHAVGHNELVLASSMHFFRQLNDDPAAKSTALAHGVVEVYLELIAVITENSWDCQENATVDQSPSQLQGQVSEGKKSSADISEASKESIRMFLLHLWTHRRDQQPLVSIADIPSCATDPEAKDPATGKFLRLSEQMAKARKTSDISVAANQRLGAGRGNNLASKRLSVAQSMISSPVKLSPMEEEAKRVEAEKRRRDAQQKMLEQKLTPKQKQEFEVKKKAIYWARKVAEQLKPGEKFPEPQVGEFFKTQEEVVIAKLAILESRQQAIKQIEKEARKQETYVAPSKRPSQTGGSKPSWDNLHEVSELEQEVLKSKQRKFMISEIGEMQIQQAQQRNEAQEKISETKSKMIQMPLGWERQNHADNEVESSLGNHVISQSGRRHEWERSGLLMSARSSRAKGDIS